MKNIGKRKTIVDPENNPDFDKYAVVGTNCAKTKEITMEECCPFGKKSALFCHVLMIKSGRCRRRGCGARSATGDVLRPALQIVKTERA